MKLTGNILIGAVLVAVVVGVLLMVFPSTRAKKVGAAVATPVVVAPTVTPPADLSKEVSAEPGKSVFVFTPAPVEERVISSGMFRVPPKEPVVWTNKKGDAGIIFIEPFIFEGSCTPEEAKAKIIANAPKEILDMCKSKQGYAIEDYQVAIWGWSSGNGPEHKKTFVLRSPRVSRIVYGSEFGEDTKKVLASPEGQRLRGPEPRPRL